MQYVIVETLTQPPICYEFNFDEGEFALYALPSATHNFNNFEIANSVAK